MTGDIAVEDDFFMTKELTEELVGRITDYSGIRVAPVLADYVSVYVGKQAARKGCAVSDYCRLLKPGKPEFSRLITEITTNETYFFREERQFKLLREKVFPRFSGRKMVIWSAASASGEEAVSLYALAADCGVTPRIYATDIDQRELDFFRRGVYPRSSFCEDGRVFHPLLVSSGCGLFDETRFRLHRSFTEKLQIRCHNLVGDAPPPIDEPVNLIFLRNVFIYFDDERRRAVLKKLASVLAPGGLIFLAFGEIGSISPSMIPPGLEKVNVGPVYFLMKSEMPAELGPEAEVAVKTEKPGGELRTAPAVPAEPSAAAAPSRETKPARTSWPVHAASPEPEFMFHVLKWLVAAGEHDVARGVVAGYRPSGDGGVYGDFFRGYIEKAARNIGRAESLLLATEQGYPDFWPAYFYHGILLKEQSRDEEAVPLFKKCAALLEEYESSGSSEFDFLAESFSPAYFSILCMKFTRLS